MKHLVVAIVALFALVLSVSAVFAELGKI